MTTELVVRTFEVDVPTATAWELLADVEAWPQWAPHIRRAVLDDATLGPDSTGTFTFSPVGSAEFHMTAWDPPNRWTWHGRAMGLPIDYHHDFIDHDGRAQLTWRVDLVSESPGLRSRLFAAIYRRNIDRAWPGFVAWAEREAGVADGEGGSVGASS